MSQSDKYLLINRELQIMSLDRWRPVASPDVISAEAVLVSASAAHLIIHNWCHILNTWVLFIFSSHLHHSIHSLVVLSHFSTQIIHIIIIITQHLPVVPVDTPVVVWGVEWQVFVSRDRGHWPARALSCPLEEAQLTGPSGTTTLQPFIMNQDTARSPGLTTIPIIAIMPRIHHPRVPDSGQSCQRTFAKFHNARRRPY